MRSSNRSGKRGRFLSILLIAALVVVGRAPFLVRGDRFFDSDEAVEGLMASHVLRGEHPAFLWGSRQKGVPEVYLVAAVFAVTGPSIVALKSVTLACFAVFVAMQFVLVERLFSRAVAWLATAFLIVAPPSLVLWSLNANAEIVLTLLAGTLVCLGFDIWRRTGARAALVVACAAIGFGLWVQQFILYYIVTLGLAVLYDLPRRRELVGDFIAARGISPRGRVVLYGVASVGLACLVLGAAARADLRGIMDALSPMARQAVPIVFGFRSPSTGWLGVPAWLGLAIALVIGVSFTALRRQAFTPLFHILLITTPLIFLLSGAYVNAQPYRYLMPMAGALSVVMALGVWAAFRRSRVFGIVLLGVLITAFALEQRAWYRELQPDLQSAAIIACLDREGVRAAHADYSLSYKLTFLTNERIIVVPNAGTDRYAPYRDYVRAQASAPTIPATIGAPCVQDTSSSR